MPRHSEATLSAIKRAVDIVALVGDYLPLQRVGSKYRALCPFHDDHNPSLELNPDRQSFKCWSCGAGGDIFDFVKAYERVDFPEALRMLAARAGIVLEAPTGRPSPPASAASKTELLAVNAWAQAQFAQALSRSDEAQAYLEQRRIAAESVARFGLGYAPSSPRDWLRSRARAEGIPLASLEQAGLVVRAPARDGEPVRVRERFQGRLMFPIHDPRGQTLGFGGRILPLHEQALVTSGRRVAKYLNTPETVLFQKRRTLYAADLARAAARQHGWVAVVEGYTDVIAAHQVGLTNVVGTLGTALGDDHVQALRRLADRVVLIFDGDTAGRQAADRALELFLSHEVDLRVLSLPEGQDPCDVLLEQGAEAFRDQIAQAVDPLSFVIDRAAARFNFESLEEARQAAQWVLSILARVPNNSRAGLDVKVDQALLALSGRLRTPVTELRRLLRTARRPSPTRSKPSTPAAPAPAPSWPRTTLNPIDRELIQIVLNEPAVVAGLITRVTPGALRDAPLRTILQTCYDLHGAGQSPTFEQVSLRLDEPTRALAAGLLLPVDPQPLSDQVRPAPWDVRLAGVLVQLAERQRQDRLRALKGALTETDDPEQRQALRLEYRKLLNQRLDTKSRSAS